MSQTDGTSAENACLHVGAVVFPEGTRAQPWISAQKRLHLTVSVTISGCCHPGRKHDAACKPGWYSAQCAVVNPGLVSTQPTTSILAFRSTRRCMGKYAGAFGPWSAKISCAAGPVRRTRPGDAGCAAPVGGRAWSWGKRRRTSAISGLNGGCLSSRQRRSDGVNARLTRVPSGPIDSSRVCRNSSLEPAQAQPLQGGPSEHGVAGLHAKAQQLRFEFRIGHADRRYGRVSALDARSVDSRKRSTMYRGGHLRHQGLDEVRQRLGGDVCPHDYEQGRHHSAGVPQQRGSAMRRRSGRFGPSAS